VSQEYLYFEIGAVESILYPLTCSLFEHEDYLMPPLRWHDRGRMESALGAVRSGYYGDILEAAASLAYYVNKAHALIDGNKRMTVVVLYSFLLMNGYVQTEAMTYDELVAFTEWLAGSEQSDMQKVVQQIRERLAGTLREMDDAEYAEIFG
jgi:death on curing protein